MPLTIGSLFSGIGGLELGLERGIGDGCHTIWQVEQDAYCRAVLAKHWPNAKRYEDVRDVGRETLEAVDIICGGFPCQDISAAGKRAGIRGARSGLWSEYVRIVREMGPAYVVVENVSALLAGGLDIVLGELAQSGYDAEWDCLPASSVGAPHRRDRIFILAYPNQGGRQWARTAQGSSHARTDGRDYAGWCSPKLAHASIEGNVRRDWQLREDACPPERREDNRRGTSRNDSGQWWDVEPDVGRVANGVPSRVDRLRALGNAVVPQVAEVVGRLIAEREKELRDVA